MSYLKLLSAILVVLLLVSACKKEPIEESISNSPGISFSAMEAGQKDYYVLLRGEDIFDNDNYNFEYLADTLAIEVVSNDENGWLVKEYLTSGSASLHGDINVAYADSTLYYYIYNDGNSIKLRQWGNYYRTRLFFLEENAETGLMLQNISSPETEIKGWKTTLPFSETYITATTSSLDLFGTNYSKLNVLIDNSKMVEDQPGSTHVFSKENGLVRSTQYSAYTGKGEGWDLLPR